jgi:DNA replication and repair protein RecF
LASEPFDFAPGTTLFFGENGAGKTNILEAAATLAGRPSFRQAEPADMANGGAFCLFGSVSGDSGREQIGVEWSAGRPKRFERAGKKASVADIAQSVPAIFLAPEDRALFTGSPQIRRRFLDRLAITLYPAALEECLDYQRALAHRNAILSDGAPDSASLETWNEEFFRKASVLAVRRRQVFSAWKDAFSRRVRGAGTLSGLDAFYSGEEGTQAEIREQFVRKAAELAGREKLRGHTLFGPHRSDIEFRRGERQFGTTSSTGEMMRAAFLVRLAEGEAVARQRGVLPLYALDDFDAELSPGASEQLLSQIPESAQVFLTSAHPESVSGCPRKPEAVFEIIAGRAFALHERAQLRKIG